MKRRHLTELDHWMVLILLVGLRLAQLGLAMLAVALIFGWWTP
jgi:hypothetical protein